MIAEPTRLQIIRGLSRVANATARELAGEGGRPNTLRRHLEALVSLGAVLELPASSDGRTPGRPPTRYVLHPDLKQNVLAFYGIDAREEPGTQDS